MTDLSKTIAPKSDQLNADDLIAGPRTITVREVRGVEDSDQPVSIFFEGDNGKPYKPGLSMRRVMVKIWGSDGNTYTGKRMTLYTDPEVKFGGIKVGGIRISHMSGIDKPVSMPLTATRGKRAEFRVQPLAEDDSGQVLMNAEQAAEQGTEAFTAFYNSPEGKANRALLKDHLAKFKKTATAADEAAKPLSQRIAENPKPAPQAEGEPEGGGHSTSSGVNPDPFSDAYKAGAEAQGDGKTEADCPHDDGPDRDQWILGFQYEASQ